MWKKFIQTPLDFIDIPITDETETYYTPTESGNYAVEITQNGCTAISECMSLTLVGVQQNTKQLVNVNPNPNNGNFKVLLQSNNITQLQLIDVTGKLIMDLSQQTHQKEINISEIESGVYFLKADSQTYRVVVTK